MYNLKMLNEGSILTLGLNSGNQIHLRRKQFSLVKDELPLWLNKKEYLIR